MGPPYTTFFILGVVILVVYVLLAQLLVRDPALKKQYPDNARRPDDGTPPREEGLAFREILRRSFRLLYHPMPNGGHHREAGFMADPVDAVVMR